MIKSSDLLHLPYTIDLTRAGIAHACNLLATSHRGSDILVVNYLKHVIGITAVELAFRHHLSGEAIPFRVVSTNLFNPLDRYNILLGGHRCQLISYQISHQRQMEQLRGNPMTLLQAPALIPIEKFVMESHKMDDIYIFAFIIGDDVNKLSEMDKNTRIPNSTHYLYALSNEWAFPRNWRAIENFVLKSECKESLKVELGGQSAKREFMCTTLDLPSKIRVPVGCEFFSVAYINAERKPEARIGVHTTVHGEATIISTHQWRNIWLCGKEIILVGWLSYEEFKRRAKVLNVGMSTFQYHHTRKKNLMVPISGLNPLAPLLARAKKWESERILPSLEN